MQPLSIVPKWNWNNVWIKQIFWRLRYQSYQSGIETSDGYSGQPVICAINRTKVELKLDKNLNTYAFINYQSYQSGIETTKFLPQTKLYCLSIVPKWNWNGIASGRKAFPIRLSIVPKWNWNNGTIFLPATISGLSIVPKWNWNYFRIARSKAVGHLSIVPKWNWNLLLRLKIMAICLLLSIVPKWNWNKANGLIFGGLVSLSIVPKWNWNNGTIFLPATISAINRTKVELKPTSSTAKFLRRSYQSYQSGIETALMPVRRQSFWTINRTKVELKHH